MLRTGFVLALFCLGLLIAVSDRGTAQVHLLGHPGPEIGGGPWLNSQPLTPAALRGRVVLVEFWTGG
jgi:hypothetical protein